MLPYIRSVWVGSLVCLGLVTLLACKPIAAPVAVEQTAPPIISIEEAQQNAPFALPEPNWLPEELVREGARVVPPNQVQVVYDHTTNAEAGLWIEVTKGTPEGAYHFPDAAKEQVMVAEQPAVCVQGAWDNAGQWHADADSGMLEWSANGFHYRIGHSGLKLTCDELIRVAASIPTPAEA